MSKSLKIELKEWIKSITLAFILALFLKIFIFTVTYVDGESMHPTLKDGDRLVLSKYKTTLRIEKFNRGDIVVFKSPVTDQNYIKRIIAIENDLINIINGKVVVNGEALDEDYIESNISTDPVNLNREYKIPKGKVYVIGDNRRPKSSHDSRDFGPIKISAIKGKTKYRVYPDITELQ